MAMLVCGIIYYKRVQVSKQLNNRHTNPRDIALDSDVYILKEEETKGNRLSLYFLFCFLAFLLLLFDFVLRKWKLHLKTPYEKKQNK